MMWVWDEFTLGATNGLPCILISMTRCLPGLATIGKDRPIWRSEIEFWLGEGKDREKIEFNTSTLVFVPRGLVHMPIVYKKKVHRPILHIVIGINSGPWVGEKVKAELVKCSLYGK